MRSPPGIATALGLLSALGLAFSCGEPPEVDPGADAAVDAGVARDAGAQGDGGPVVDGGAQDAGSLDGGQSVDAGLPDAGAPPDAGADAGTQPCVDDALEEDDTPDSGTARTVRMSLLGQPIELADQVACPDDADYLRGYADCCPGFGVTVRWDAGAGPLEVELLKTDLTPYPLTGAEDLNVRDAGYVRLLEKDEGGTEFLVRIRSSRRIPYDVTLLAPVYGP